MTPAIHRNIFSALLSVAFLALSTVAHASSYLAIDGSSVTINNSVENDLNPRGLRLRLGVRVSETFDLEAHFGGGTDQATQAFDEFSAAYMGVYLKGYVPIGQRSALFAMAGGASVELTQTVRGGRFSDDRAGFSYGFGLETQLSHSLDLSADYMRYTLDDDEFSEASAVNLGLKWYF
ncbi:MAG: porin family protein [Granulosicoccus sp.]